MAGTRSPVPILYLDESIGFLVPRSFVPMVRPFVPMVPVPRPLVPVIRPLLTDSSQYQNHYYVHVYLLKVNEDGQIILYEPIRDGNYFIF